VKVRSALTLPTTQTRATITVHARPVDPHCGGDLSVGVTEST